MKTDTPCALITGASQGLGRALAWECAARGMNLFLIALPGSELPELAEDIERETGSIVEWLEADLLDPDAPDRILRRIEDDHIPVDLLVNNAGIGTPGEFRDHALEYHEKTILLNQLALIRIIRHLLPRLERRPGGRILNVASLGAFFSMPTLPVYSATKGFVLSFSLALREELKGSIGVSVLCPNAIRAAGSVNEYIDSLGPIARCACLTPQRIARTAIDGALRGKAVIVPGVVNCVVAAIARLVPRRMINKTIRHYWGNFLKAQRFEPRRAVGTTAT